LLFHSLLPDIGGRRGLPFRWLATSNFIHPFQTTFFTLKHIHTPFLTNLPHLVRNRTSPIRSPQQTVSVDTFLFPNPVFFSLLPVFIIFFCYHRLKKCEFIPLHCVPFFVRLLNIVVRLSSNGCLLRRPLPTTSSMHVIVLLLPSIAILL